jgi:cell division protein FtsB
VGRGGDRWRPGLLLRIGRAVGVTSTRRATVLAVMVFALGLSVAVPLQNYLDQRADLAEVRARQEVLAERVAELQHRRELLTDPNYVEAQARERLGYVYPGETPYMVQLPQPSGTAAAPERESEPREPWYARLWRSITGTGG